MARNCLGVKSSGNCGCEGYVFERVAGAYEECFCGHVKGTHITDTAKVVEPAPVKAPTKKVVVSKVETTLTPAEARAKLRAAGHTVGQRGRLSPDQMALAATL